MSFVYKVTIDSKENNQFCQITWQKEGTNEEKSYIETGKVFQKIEKLRGQWFQRKNRMDVGRKIFHLLDGDKRLFLNALEEAKSQGEIPQINLYTYDAISRWPFELLAYGNRFYLPYDLHLVRCVSDCEIEHPITPKNRPLDILFMNCPAYHSKPDFLRESEEKVISQIKKFQGIDTDIEYLGTLKGLSLQLGKKRYDVLYLSGCFDIDESGHPYLLMNVSNKKEENLNRVYPANLWDDALIENPPQLLFITSFYNCLMEPAKENLAASYFGQQLAKAHHLPALITWDLPARDPWVNDAEVVFLRELGRGQTILETVHRIRDDLYKKTRNKESILWALLQLYGTGRTLDALVSKNLDKQPVSLTGSLEFPQLGGIDKKVIESGPKKYIERPDYSFVKNNFFIPRAYPATSIDKMNKINYDAHDLSLQTGKEALNKIKQFSQIAFQDAGFVSESPHSKDGPDIRLEQNLYVVRTIEKDIHKLIDDSSTEKSSFLLIFGEAGSGKTSLLWHFFHSFSQTGNVFRDPWFIKSGALYTSIEVAAPSDAGSQLTLPELAAAAAMLKQQGKQAVILLDTVDLLLHTEKHREYLVALLLTLKEYGCQIIATSRPQEAVHLFAHTVYRKLLGEYDKEELEKAITGHIRCFYGRVAARDMVKHKESILNAVSNGLQIREVCTNPLTLRMLFTLYAPQDIPKEINTFQLYRNYWEMRVVKDHRAGSSYSLAEDLGGVAAEVALAMLAEGVPELRNLVLERRFRQCIENSNRLEKLESRGILQRSEDNTFHFFHQTFFEHCAARGMLMRFPNQVISLLQDRLEANPNDLFVSPVMEQVLLLIEDEAQCLRTKGDGFLLYLLQSRHQLLKCSGIYVYIHRRVTGRRLQDEVQQILSGSEYAIVNHFLRLAPNMPQVKERYRILFQELAIAWSRDSVDARALILELLERFCSRFPQYVEDFLKDHNILDFSPDQWELGFKTTANIIEILVTHSPPQRHLPLIGQLLRVLEHKISDALVNCIIELLERLSIALNSTVIASQCEKAMQLREDKDDQKHSIPLARLFYVQWKNAGISFEKILEELTGSQGFSFKARLRALCRILLTASGQEASLAWENFIAEPDDNKKWMWAHLVVPSMIVGYPVSDNSDKRDEEMKAGSWGKSPSVSLFREKIKTLFTRWSTLLSGEELKAEDIAAEINIFQKIRKAVILANPEKEILLDLLSAPVLAHSSPWLSMRLFGELLAHAYNSGNTGAVEAMHLLISQPGDYPKELINSAGLNFRELNIGCQSILETAVSFYLKTGKAKFLSQLLYTNCNLFQSLLPEWQEKIDALARKLVTDPSEENRKNGIGLWKCLISCFRIEAPPLPELVNLLEKETRNYIKSPIIQLIGLKTDILPGDAVRVLLPYTSHVDENIRSSAFQSLLDILLKYRTELALYAESMLNAILKPPVIVESVRKFGLVLSELVPEHTQLALKFLEHLLVFCSTGIKNRSKRNLLNYFRAPVRRTLRYAPLSSYDHFLQLVPKLKTEMGLLIVEAICHEAFAEMTTKLDILLEHPNVPGKVKELIRRNKYNRERTLGGEGWSELEKLLSSDFYNGTDAGHKKILFLSANPEVGAKRLGLDREYREIDRVLRGAKNRHQFKLIPKLAVRYTDIREAMLDHEPQIVHFSGHGKENGLMVLDELGISLELMPVEAISKLFKLCSRHVDCVILNACYSESQAEVIAEHIPYVIGMKKEIKDTSAIAFAAGFYDALRAGRPIEEAFQYGLQAIMQSASELPRDLIPVLKKRKNRT